MNTQPAPATATPEAPEPSHTQSLKGTTTLLMGAPGTGKTTSLATLVAAGLETFAVLTDPGGDESLLDAMDRLGLDRGKLHYAYLAPAAPKWADLTDMARKINTMSYEDISKLKSGVAKTGYTQFLQLLSLLANFKCDCCGKEWGAVDAWGAERALALDSFSGINTMIWNMTVGAKPAAHQGEWGVAMNASERFLDKLTADLKCFLVLTAHVDREVDEVMGGTKIMVSALGRKLAPKIPRNFSDVVQPYREGDKFWWTTVATGTDLKARNLPLRDKLEPSFVQIVEAWRKRNKSVLDKASPPQSGA